jgi:hypothetical protein
VIDRTVGGVVSPSNIVFSLTVESELSGTALGLKLFCGNCLAAAGEGFKLENRKQKRKIAYANLLAR